MLEGNAGPAQLLREAGLRVTPQRLAIARAVLRRQHPTAAEVFEVVRKQFPTMGLATVYATLNTMSRCGLLRPMPFADAVRFDANVVPHANLICVNCGSIADFDGCDDVLRQLRERTAEAAGFSFGGERLDLHGTCAACSILARAPAPAPGSTPLGDSWKKTGSGTQSSSSSAPSP